MGVKAYRKRAKTSVPMRKSKAVRAPVRHPKPVKQVKDRF